MRSLSCGRLASAGVPIGNQSVLLRGINDDIPTMPPGAGIGEGQGPAVYLLRGARLRRALRISARP